MGQYFYVVNETKREYLHPHKFDEGLKLAEFGLSGGGTLSALAWLLADNPDRWPHAVAGRWKGDAITVAGDYGPEDRTTSDGRSCNLHDLASEEFTDISGLCAGISDF